MATGGAECVVFPSQPIAQLLVKVAARCNIECSYCYWFRDASVYDKPKLMSAEVLHQLLWRLEEHVLNYAFNEFPITLHGGEPLLWGIDNFYRIAEGCEAISARTGCELPIAVTTNGILIDDAWLDCFETHNITIAVSLDGPAHIHDLRRRTFRGAGTHSAVERAARMLVARDINVSALAVCNPAHGPKEYFDFFAACGISTANRHKQTVNIRIVTDMVSALLGNDAPTEGIGYKPIELCTVMTDGSVEAHDVLRIAGDGVTQTTFNIFEHAIDEVRNELQWKSAREASINLCEKCRECKFMSACGGGYLPHRFSKEKGYDNPSVYCDDLYATFEHIASVLESYVYVVKPGKERFKLSEELSRVPG